MRLLPLFLIIAGFAMTVSLAQAETPASVPITVEETAGLRRFGYPVTVHVPLPRGAAPDASRLVLESGEAPLRGVQYDPGPRWPDGSLQWVTLAFNLSPGPGEKTELRLRYGPGVSHADPGSPVVETTPDLFVIRGIYRIGRTGEEFIRSIRYGTREFLTRPAVWRVWESDGSQPLALAPGKAASRVLFPGPVNAVVGLAGAYSGRDGPVPYRLTVSQPNSKSWFDAALEVGRAGHNIRQVELVMPYTVEKEPALFDFGVGSWVYGALRGKEAARLEDGKDRQWKILTGADPATAQVYAAASRTQPRAEGWGHLVDGAQGGRVVAFGTPDAPGGSLESRSLRVDAAGEVTLTWRWSGRGTRRARALFHHVGDPVQVSAATSPPSMLIPLRVTLPESWYRQCGAGRAFPEWSGEPER